MPDEVYLTPKTAPRRVELTPPELSLTLFALYGLLSEAEGRAHDDRQTDLERELNTGVVDTLRSAVAKFQAAAK